MEILIIEELGVRTDGTKIVKRLLINPEPRNVLKDAQSWFSKDEKKIAKLQHKEYLRTH